MPDSTFALAMQYSEKCGATREVLNWLSGELQNLVPWLSGYNRAAVLDMLETAKRRAGEIDTQYASDGSRTREITEQYAGMFAALESQH